MTSRVAGLRQVAAIAVVLAGLVLPGTGPAHAQGAETLAPCLDPALAASHADLIAAFQSEGWTEPASRDLDRGAWFKAATFDPPKRFWNERAAQIWQRDMRAWWDDVRIGYVTLARDDLTLVLKGTDAPLGRGPAHCMLIADDLEGQDHGTDRQSVDKPAVAAYFWSGREIDTPTGFSAVEARFSTLELVEGQRIEMFDIYMKFGG